MPKNRDALAPPLSREAQTGMMVGAISQAGRLLDRPELPQSYWVVFWSVAYKPGVTATTICRYAGLSKRTVSRNLKLMGEGEKGEGLITQHLDPDNLRLRRLYLTKKGERLYKTLLDDVSEAYERMRIQDGKMTDLSGF